MLYIIWTTIHLKNVLLGATNCSTINDNDKGTQKQKYLNREMKKFKNAENVKSKINNRIIQKSKSSKMQIMWNSKIQ